MSELDNDGLPLDWMCDTYELFGCRDCGNWDLVPGKCPNIDKLHEPDERPEMVSFIVYPTKPKHLSLG